MTQIVMSKLMGWSMGRQLWALVDDYLTRADRSEAALARQVGLKPQTLNSWKHRGFKTPPDPDTLRSLARVLGAPYADVLMAALRDTGYLEEGEAGPGAGDPLSGLSVVQRALVLGIVEELRSEPEPSAIDQDRISGEVVSGRGT
ncbi:helix-turn-helix transcriptional regulator [Cellulomonas sp. C5510]|uniref:helix-turn-helix domain-containing protein n=1 Tax=Cellulomonas sp. C5510 TaxID=2871170 RepID=UPI001C96B362|nr:helix-turn-helix transcriptional regulator [Cellulomonas sp. C5510]QZN85436.1 helix-turn-helix transcriptional regulator [Cellulomonas sp. C5510]